MKRSSLPLAPQTALAHLPKGLRGPLVDAFNRVVANFREGRWEPSELNGGKLCEIAYSILRGCVDESYPLKPSKPRNLVEACHRLENADAKKFSRSIRIQIPRAIVVLYEIRNNRNVGHVGGDVDPNHMDAVAVLSMSKWIVAELVRIFHDVTTEEATAVVEGLITREIPIIWEVAGTRKVLDSSLKMRDRMLLLLYAYSPLREQEIVQSLEHSNPSVFRRDVIGPSHRTHLVHYDAVTRLVHISPLGTRYVEQNLPLSIA